MSGDNDNIVAILLTKNETDLIEDFLEYYGRVLGGRDRVVVVDNGSDSNAGNVAVQNAYTKHTSLGGRVIVDARSFRDANLFMSEHIRDIVNTQANVEWIMPLETDEFLFEVGGPSVVDPVAMGKVLRETLAEASEKVGLLRYGKFLGSLVDPKDPGYERGAYTRPAVQQTRFFDQGWDKLILRASAFVRMHMWCHHAELREGFAEATAGRLGLLHFHETGLRRRVDRAAQVVYAYRYLSPTWTLDEQLARARQLYNAPIACGHRLNELLVYLERRATLEAFKRYLGRLPHSVAELGKYASHPCPADAVRKDIATGQLGAVGPSLSSLSPTSSTSNSWDALLYHEERGSHEHEFQYHINLASAASTSHSHTSTTTHSAYSTLLEHLGQKYNNSAATLQPHLVI